MGHVTKVETGPRVSIAELLRQATVWIITTMKWTPRRLKFALNVYPPYLGAGVSITKVDRDWRELKVSMKLRWYNRNAVGSHFGGSLYSMVDPHLMLLLMKLLGEDYVVWDKAASIDSCGLDEERFIRRFASLTTSSRRFVAKLLTERRISPSTKSRFATVPTRSSQK